jgi:four helix bundle protein
VGVGVGVGELRENGGWGAGRAEDGWGGALGYGGAPTGRLPWGMRPERIRMWQAAELLVAEVDGLVRRAGGRAANAVDHLERSAESLLFNVAEGAGAYRPKVKISAYEVAKKEANEVRAVLRRLVIKKAATHADIHRAYNLAGSLVGMLTAAIIRLEQRQ